MASGISCEIITHTPDQTHELGLCLGRSVQTGLIMRLVGNLGSGKTCFIQGLARGLGVPAEYDITSPSYNLISQYPGRLPFYHADLYRLNQGVDAELIGLWDTCTDDAVLAVEWADRLDDAQWPTQTLQIIFHTQKDDSRRIQLLGSGLIPHNLIKESSVQWKQLNE